MTTEADYLQLLLAPNPGPMTLDGTNTWIIGDPSRGAPIVVDPGPLEQQHLDAVLRAAGGQVAAIVLTHRHADHSAGAVRLAEQAGCGVLAADPACQVGPRSLEDGDVLQVPGATLRALTTPGHTSDSYSLLLTGEDQSTRLLTGDMVLGRGTTVIAAPDGDLGDYLASLELMERLVADQRVAEILPGHGPRVANPAQLLSDYREHRLQRLEQVRAALAAGDRTPAEVVARVYADIDRSLRRAAEQSVTAQLAYLTGRSAD